MTSKAKSKRQARKKVCRVYKNINSDITKDGMVAVRRNWGDGGA